MAELYGVSVSAINQHLKNIFEDGELQEDAVIKKYLITATDGKQYKTNHYNLQAIISVGFNNVGSIRNILLSAVRMAKYTKTPLNFFLRLSMKEFFYG